MIMLECKKVAVNLTAMQEEQIVLIGFLTDLALHLERSTLNHSYGYGPAVERPNCCASLARNPDPCMQYAGSQ
jgi:hypothetical protein